MMNVSMIPATLLVGLLLFSTQIWAAQVCHANIPLQAPDSRYVANGNGTVTDKVTNLVWQSCSIGQTYNQNGTGGCGGTASTHTWKEALAQAKSANTTQLLGFSDWRLPSIAELHTLVELACAYSAINLNYFPNAIGKYWSATPDVGIPYNAWVVEFDTGFDTMEEKNSANHVRLVRGGQ